MTRGGHQAERRSSKVMLYVALTLTVAPVLILGFTPWNASGSLWYLGALPVIMALFASVRVAYAAALLTPLFIGVGLALSHSPALGALYMAALGALTGLSSTRGWHVTLSFAAPLAALAVIGEPRVSIVPATEAVLANSSPEAMWWAMGTVLAGGLWTATFGRLVFAQITLPPVEIHSLRAARYYAITLAVLCGAGTYVAMTWLGPNSWWMLLTFFVVVQPSYGASLTRLTARVVGTVAGALLAITLVYFFHDQRAVLAVLALALTVAAAYANLSMPYWVFAALLTPAVVLQTSGGAYAILHSTEDRVLYTLIGGGVAFVVMWAAYRLLVRPEDREAASEMSWKQRLMQRPGHHQHGDP